MNMFSWLLYLSDASSRVSGLTGFLSILFGLAALLFFILRLVPPDAWTDNAESSKSAHDTVRASFKGLTVTFVFIVSIWLFVPSKNTVLQMAASEFVGNVAQLEEVQNLGGEVGELAHDSVRMLREYLNTSLETKEEVAK